ncbi:MAG: PKD domain-containing protein [Hamadaea sp.]|nr:PKD domain-containing protein [Hamadaea sp.]
MARRDSARRRLMRAGVAGMLLAAVLTPVRGGVAEAATLPAGFQEQIVFSGLSQPVNLEFAPDGRIFVAEKAGAIKIFDDLSDTTPTVFANLASPVHSQWDRGLLGMALPPNFPTSPYVYVLYAYGVPLSGGAAKDDSCTGVSGGANGGNCVVSARLSRLQISGNVMTGSEQVLINDWCQQFPSHSIGDLKFGPDGMLYASAGDGASFNATDYGQFGSPVNPCGDPSNEGGALRSQDLRSTADATGLDGGILRLDPATGAAASGNPNIGSADLNTRRFVAIGLRNPYRFTFRPGTSEIWAGDVGWSTWEEIDRVVNPLAGTTNFGWPCYEGNSPQSGYDNANLSLCESLYTGGGHTTPYYTYNHSSDIVPGEGCAAGGDAITGLAFYPASGGSYPAAYGGSLFFADNSRTCIWAMKPATAGGLPSTSNIELFVKAAASPVDLAVGPGGELYYADLGGTIRRIRYFPGNQPPTAVVNATPTSGSAPLAVSFDGTGSTDLDPADQGRLTYAWDFTNDGSIDSTAAAPSFTYTSAGTYTAKLTVTDTLGATGSATVSIQAGNTAPTATMTTPTVGTTWVVGQSISFSGGATDPQQGALPASALSWQLQMQHCETPGNCHTHPLQTWNGVASGSFVAPDHEYPSYLELILTATDSQGLTNTVLRRLDPETVDLTFATNPVGLTLTVGSTTQVTPFTRTVIKGSTNSVSAPTPQSSGAITYTYASWSDGGAQTHVITAPGTAATYTAGYTGSTPACSDSYGYTCAEGTATWSAAATKLTLEGDDAFQAVTLPFGMPFYGSTSTTAWVDTNGVLTFTNPGTSAWNQGAIPSTGGTAAPNNALYPFWDDLIVDGSSGIYTSSSGLAPNRQFTVEWRNVRFYEDSSSRVSFKIVLHENGTVVYGYTDIGTSSVEKGSSATIGIENSAGTVALQYSLNTAKLVNNRTITFTPPGVTPAPPPPANGSVTGTVTNAGTPVAGAAVSVVGTSFTATTAANGTYTIGNVPPGAYTVTATAADSRCSGLAGSAPATVTSNATATANIALVASGAGHGYTCAEGAFTFVQASTALTLTGDDAFQAVTLPFAMPFYGGSYSTAYVDTNGVVSFAAPDGAAWGFGSIPSTSAPHTPNLAIYPFWDDLIADGQSSIRTQTIGSAPNRQFVIEWRNMRSFASTTERVSFAVILNENGTFTLAYTDVDSASTWERGGAATIGVENGNGTVALQYSFREAVLASGRGITFTPAS